MTILLVIFFAPLIIVLGLNIILYLGLFSVYIASNIPKPTIKIVKKIGDVLFWLLSLALVTWIIALLNK